MIFPLMLTLGGTAFTTGRASYADHGPDPSEETARIYIQIEPGNLGYPLFAILDTGSPWCIFPAEVVESAGGGAVDERDVTLRTSRGPKTGRLHRMAITLVAEEGVSLEIDATVFVSRDWDGPNFIGYTGLLERIRFALDPPRQSFYFGLPEE